MNNYISYFEYQTKLNLLLQNPVLQEYGIRRYVIGKTKYSYDLDYITIGYGKKDIFLVAGTHGSEIISTDFVLKLIEQLPTLENFDPNDFTLKIIPLHNPEGYDITTNTFKNIKPEEFVQTSYQYYLKYRADTIIYQAIHALENFALLSSDDITDDILRRIKVFMTSHPKWMMLKQDRVFPQIESLNRKMREIKDIHSKEELCGIILMNLKQEEEKTTGNTVLDEMYLFFLKQLEEIFIELLIQRKEEVKIPKLYQNMFKDSSFDGLQSKKLVMDIENIYQQYSHPMGSQINFEANGSGINLNANHLLNMGIDAMRNQEIVYGLAPKDNIQKYVPGPIGTPTLDANHFSYSIENILLENLIRESCFQGRYQMTLLYHSSGGLIYYKPYQELMDASTYLEFYQYNQFLASIYQQSTNYKILESSDTSGYGDYLRRNYKGVLLIELSKMGGNPIGPYGDLDNVEEVYSTNIKALDNIMASLKKENVKRREKVK